MLPPPITTLIWIFFLYTFLISLAKKVTIFLSMPGNLFPNKNSPDNFYKTLLYLILLIIKFNEFN